MRLDEREMLCYLDDSGTDNQSSVVTMAGYLGTSAGWSQFEERARQIFSRYNISSFHAKDYHDTKGQFRGWTRIKKRSFVVEMATIAAEFIKIGISCSVRKRMYLQRKLETKLNVNTSAYGFCFIMIINELLPPKPFAMRQEEVSLSFFLEAGNVNDRDVERCFDAVRNKFDLQRVLASISFVDKDRWAAVQWQTSWHFIRGGMLSLAREGRGGHWHLPNHMI